MSYSFNVRAATKAEAKAAAEAKFDEVLQYSPEHARDRDAAMANLDACLALVEDDASMDVAVSMSGYLAGEWAQGKLARVTGASMHCNAGLAAKV